MLPKLIEIIKKHLPEITLISGIILIAITSFNFGKMRAFSSLKTPLTITTPTTPDIVRPIEEESDKAVITNQTDQTIVASKKSSGKVYHFLWCPGANLIAKENKIFFNNESAALAAGYHLAANCKK